MNLEGSKAGPRPGFDSCPRVTESGTTRDALMQGQGSSHALEAPQDAFEAKREGRRRNPLRGRYRALKSYRKESRSTRPLFRIFESAGSHSNPLLIAHRRPSELVQTRVVRRSPPSSLFLKREHEGQTIKDGRDSDRPHAREARGLGRRKPNLERKKTEHAMIREHSSKRTCKRPQRSQNTPPRPRGLHPAGALTCPHRKSYNAMTPDHEPLSLCESDPHSPKGSGATISTYN
jgi:hypothetical protein